MVKMKTAGPVLAIAFFLAGYMVSAKTAHIGRAPCACEERCSREGISGAYPPRAAETEVIELSRSSVSWEGSALPGYPRAQPEITILRITVPPGTSLPEHKHPVINAGVLLKGELRVISERGEELLLKEGDAIVEVVDIWHYGVNPGNVPAEIIVFYAGASGMPITVGRR